MQLRQRESEGMVGDDGKETRQGARNNTTGPALFSFFLATPPSLWDLNSPTRDRIKAHSRESAESEPVDHQEIPRIAYGCRVSRKEARMGSGSQWKINGQPGHQIEGSATGQDGQQLTHEKWSGSHASFEYKKHTGCAAREKEAASKAPGLEPLTSISQYKEHKSRTTSGAWGQKIPDSVGARKVNGPGWKSLHVRRPRSQDETSSLRK